MVPVHPDPREVLGHMDFCTQSWVQFVPRWQTVLAIAILDMVFYFRNPIRQGQVRAAWCERDCLPHCPQHLAVRAAGTDPDLLIDP